MSLYMVSQAPRPSYRASLRCVVFVTSAPTQRQALMQFHKRDGAPARSDAKYYAAPTVTALEPGKEYAV